MLMVMFIFLAPPTPCIDFLNFITVLIGVFICVLCVCGVCVQREREGESTLLCMCVCVCVCDVCRERERERDCMCPHNKVHNLSEYGSFKGVLMVLFMRFHRYTRPSGHHHHYPPCPDHSHHWIRRAAGVLCSGQPECAAGLVKTGRLAFR